MFLLAVWHSSADIGCIREVTLHRARLVLGWVTMLDIPLLPGFLSSFFTVAHCMAPAPLKLRPYAAIQMHLSFFYYYTRGPKGWVTRLIVKWHYQYTNVVFPFVLLNIALMPLSPAYCFSSHMRDELISVDNCHRTLVSKSLFVWIGCQMKHEWSALHLLLLSLLRSFFSSPKVKTTHDNNTTNARSVVEHTYACLTAICPDYPDLVLRVRCLSPHIRFRDIVTAQARPIQRVGSGRHWPSNDCKLLK